MLPSSNNLRMIATLPTVLLGFVLVERAGIDEPSAAVLALIRFLAGVQPKVHLEGGLPLEAEIGN